MKGIATIGTGGVSKVSTAMRRIMQKNSSNMEELGKPGFQDVDVPYNIMKFTVLEKFIQESKTEVADQMAKLKAGKKPPRCIPWLLRQQIYEDLPPVPTDSPQYRAAVDELRRQDAEQDRLDGIG